MRARDQSTRGEMAQLISEGWPGGEALQTPGSLLEDGGQSGGDTIRSRRVRCLPSKAQRAHERADDITGQVGKANKRVANTLAGISTCQLDRKRRRIGGQWNGSTSCTALENHYPVPARCLDGAIVASPSSPEAELAPQKDAPLPVKR